MDKDSYQAYEFLPSTNNGTEQEQFFIVQDDGIFLMNRQVQFVTQVPDGVQSCTVYDVSQQQYFVDVDNSAELISVPENFILPITEGSSNLYGNSYLLQAVPTTNNDQIEDVVVEQYKQESSPNEADVDNENKQDSSCTEITLSDEQYKMLEQKGWVLLETNNKVFILDGVGLHDITSNNELIYQLKTESQNPVNLEIDSTRCSKTTIKLDGSITQNFSTKHDSLEFVIENAAPNIEDQKPEISFDYVEKEEIISAKPEILDTQNDAKSDKSLKSEPQNSKDEIPLRLQSKYFLKDLPDKIILGKTVNGKNLVAKVVKSSDCHKITPVTKRNQPEEPKITSNDNSIKIIKTEDDPIETLIQKALHSKIKCSPEQVEAAKEVVIQLVLLSTFQPSVVGRNLVITKEVNKMVDGKEISLVTGRVETLIKPKNGQWQFKYIPDLLQRLMTESVSKYSNMQESDSSARSKYRSEDYQYLHIHIIERLRPDKMETVSITLHKRYLPIKWAIENLPMNAKNRQSSRLYACSSCASVYKTESELTEHQETQCIYMEAEDTLTIDTEKITKGFDSVEVNPYYVIKTSKGTEYVCLQCSLSFNKFSNCQRHIKTHLRPKSTSDSKPVTQKEENAEEPILYKCKMCSSSYFHSATLSKHIIKAHIRNKNKLSV